MVTLAQINEVVNHDEPSVELYDTPMGCTTYCLTGLDFERYHVEKNPEVYFWRLLKQIFPPKEEKKKRDINDGEFYDDYDRLDASEAKKHLIMWSSIDGRPGHLFAQFLKKRGIGKVLISDKKYTKNHGSYMRGVIWNVPRIAYFENLWNKYGDDVKRRRRRVRVRQALPRTGTHR